jgi:hypothetical protein
MVLCFASFFCFGALNSARGKYEMASPVLLASLLMVASGILGSHFFSMYAHSASGSSIGSADHPVPLELVGNSTRAHNNINLAHIYLANGDVDVNKIGESKWCKDKLPVVGTCINRFFCVAPIMESGNSSTVWAWAGVEWTTSCHGVHIQHSKQRKAWDHDYKRGIGFLRNRHWDDAIHVAMKKYGLKSPATAPLMHWVPNPTASQELDWGMGWLVEIVCVSIYLFVIATYNYCSGLSKGAIPEARKIYFGPDDVQYQRYRTRSRGKASSGASSSGEASRRPMATV